ncbi:MAG: type II secretion system F family protein, partial [archaeon]
LPVIESLTNNIRIINNALPDLIGNVASTKRLTGTIKKTELEKVKFAGEKIVMSVVLNKRDKEKFLKDVSMTEEALKRLKKRGKEKKEEYLDYKAARGYVKWSNRFFLDRSMEMINAGRFRSLYEEIKKANLDVLFQTYIAIMLFTTFIAIFVGLIMLIFFTFFSLGFDFPFVTIHDSGFLLRAAELLWLPIVVPIATFAALYYYPSTEKDSTAKKIERELPFAVIHMSAISGSGIEPSEIFKIIGLSKEYPTLRREIRKIMNQINVYGYDLLTALNNVSKTTPSPRLSEVLSGISVTISSGGDLSDFFEKRAETLLNEYRLEREKYTRVAETFMDIYISVVIAAPMILMILLIIIQVSQLSVGLTMGQMTVIILGAIALANIIFLAVLHVKQPNY